MSAVTNIVSSPARGSLPYMKQLAKRINKAHTEALLHAGTAVRKAREAGDLLLDAKRQLPHGRWMQWLSTSCPDISDRTARAYMQVAEHLRLHHELAGELESGSLREVLAKIAATKPRQIGSGAADLDHERSGDDGDDDEGEDDDDGDGADGADGADVGDRATPPTDPQPSDDVAQALRQEHRDRDLEEPVPESEQVPFTEQPCDDCNTNEERWQRSAGNMLGELLSLRPYWRREFGAWEKFKAPSSLVTLARQAAEELKLLANQLSKQEIAALAPVGDEIRSS